MRERPGISEQVEQIIQGFIHDLTTYEDLNPKTTLIRYKKLMELKPATINRRLITLKRFFEWAVSEFRIRRDPSKPVKLVPEEKVSPRQMTTNKNLHWLLRLSTAVPFGIRRFLL